jgi:predicted AlkP superfamily phosphohydrolase/phosphomutase
MRVRNEHAKPYRALPFDLPATALRIAAADAHTDAEGVRHVPPATRQELTDVLGAVVDPDSGRPLVEEVVFAADAYPGSRSSIDAFVLWDASAPITGAQLEGGGTIRRPPPPARSGNHRPGGWFVAAGPGIDASADPATCEIVDLGVSVAAQLDVDLASTDGRVIRELAPHTAPDRPI